MRVVECASDNRLFPSDRCAIETAALSRAGLWTPIQSSISASTRSTLHYVGHDLQRPECILAEPDGTIWSADARGGVVRHRPGRRTADHHAEDLRSLHQAGSEATRYLEGTLPNGLAFARNGDFLISNFGTDCLEVMTRDGESRVLASTIEVSRSARSISSCAIPGTGSG